MKAFVSVEDSHFLFLSRRLGIKNGSFPIEELQRFIKPIKKVKQPILEEFDEDNNSTNKVLDREFNEQEYKEEIIEELASSLVVPKKTERRTRKNHLPQPDKLSKRINAHADPYGTSKSEHYYLEKQPVAAATERASSTSPK